jgi:hypothetical protein
MHWIIKAVSPAMEKPPSSLRRGCSFVVRLLPCCFWHFPPEYDTSKANPQIELEIGAISRGRFSLDYLLN